MIRSYEVVFITDAELTEEKLSGILVKVKGVLSRYEGTLIKEYVWERRRLAYPINKKNFGLYHLWYINGTGETITELHRQFRYLTEIFRFHSIRVDDLAKEAARFEHLTSSVESQPSAN